MSINLASFKKIYVVDFEYQIFSGGLPHVHCMVAKEILSGKIIRIHGPDLMSGPPFPLSEDILYVAYYSPAEMLCHLTLGWPLPTHLIDLFPEFRNIRNGLATIGGNTLLAALSYFQLSSISFDEKEEMRNLAIRGGPFSFQEIVDLIDYCESDVIATEKLFYKIIQKEMPLNHQLLRGSYMKCVANIEFNGIPLNAHLLQNLQNNFELIKKKLIAKIDQQYGVYDGTVFKQSLFECYLKSKNISWPLSENGKLKLDKDTFRDQVKSYPELELLKELRTTISEIKLKDIAMGADSRNRLMLSPFQSKTGRNQPSNSKFIFGPASWIRSLIKPEKNQAIAYIDWSQQEFGIAAALSEDPNMKLAYTSGDPYLAFAIQAKAVPEDATKKSHPIERDLYKACVLAVQYGMGAGSLAERIKKPQIYAEELLKMHREVYSIFWTWSDRCLDFAMLTGKIQTTFGWTLHIGKDANPRSIRNFPMQANGSEILRIAIILAIENGIKIIAPVHDAILIEAPIELIDEHISITQRCMEEASAIVLNGFQLRSDVEAVKYPDFFIDKRGIEMWKTVNELLADVSPENKDVS